VHLGSISPLQRRSRAQADWTATLSNVQIGWWKLVAPDQVIVLDRSMPVSALAGLLAGANGNAAPRFFPCERGGRSTKCG
jgi:hypothetical protein